MVSNKYFNWEANSELIPHNADRKPKMQCPWDHRWPNISHLGLTLSCIFTQNMWNYISTLSSIKWILHISSSTKKHRSRFIACIFCPPHNYIPGEYIRTVCSNNNLENAYLDWWNMRMGNKSMDVFNLWQVLLWYMNQLWTRHLIANVWWAVLLWRCIFILVAVFLRRTSREKH